MNWHPMKWRMGLIAIAILTCACGGDEKTEHVDEQCVPSDVRLVRTIESTSKVNRLVWTGNALIWTRQIKSPIELEGVNFEPVGEQDLMVVSVDRDGSTLWTAQLSDGRSDATLQAVDHRAHPAGGSILAAQGKVGAAHADTHLHIWRLDDSGMIVWQQTFPGVAPLNTEVLGDVGGLTRVVGTTRVDTQIHDLAIDRSLDEKASYLLAIDGQGTVVASNYLAYDSQTAPVGSIKGFEESGDQLAVAQNIGSHPSLVLFEKDGSLLEYHSWDDGDDGEALATSVVRTQGSLFVSGLFRTKVLSIGGIPLTTSGDLADAFVARADLSGNLLAVTSFGTLRNDEVRLGARGPNGDFVVGVDMARGAEGALLARFADNGDMVKRTYGGGQSVFRPLSMALGGDEVFMSVDVSCQSEPKQIIERGIYAVPIP